MLWLAGVGGSQKSDLPKCPVHAHSPNLALPATNWQQVAAAVGHPVLILELTPIARCSILANNPRLVERRGPHVIKIADYGSWPDDYQAWFDGDWA